MNPKPGCESWSKLGQTVALVAVASVFLLSRSLPADMPEYGMATLKIEDQGSQFIFNWHFFYSQMPPRFVLHEMHDESISFPNADAGLLKKYLSDIALSAFDLSVDGEKVQPELLTLTLYPNKSCAVVLRYPGRPGRKADLRAPILRYLPSSYILNVRLSSSTGVTGVRFGAAYPPVVHFVQGVDNVVRPPAPPRFSKAFLSEVGTAWVNNNWILLGIVLLLLGQPKQIAALVASIVVCWILLCFATVILDWKFHWKIPEFTLCLPTVLLCLISLKCRARSVWFTVVTVAAGLLNACYDIQQIPVSDPAQTVNTLIGLSLGFVGGIALVLIVVVPLWWECRKYPGFQEHWAPKIAWAVALLAVFLPLQKWLLG